MTPKRLYTLPFALLGIVLAVVIAVCVDFPPPPVPDEAVEAMEETEESDEEPEQELIRIPHCENINCVKDTKISDFCYRNPEDNDCYLIVSIIRDDTDETIYRSSALGPGEQVENVKLGSYFDSYGDYPVLFKIDAHALKDMGYKNSLVMRGTLTIT